MNFEIISVIYGEDFSKQLEKVFPEDLESCTEVQGEQWFNNGFIARLTYAVARLISSFL